MPDVAVNTDVDVAQSAALDALGYFQSVKRRLPDAVNPAHTAAVSAMRSRIQVGLPVELTPIQAAVLLHGDPVATASVIEYIVLLAVHEQAQIDRED